MTRSRQLLRGLCATTALTTLLVTAPVRLAPGPDGAAPGLAANAAYAKGGDDNGGSSGRGGGDRGGDNHGGSSGRGGGGDRGGDDHGGSSDRGSSDRGGGDRGGDDHGGSSGRGGGDDRGSDDHGGSSGRDDRGDDDHGRNSGRDGRDDVAGDDRTGDGATKVEIEGDKVVITFADGTKQEIENGRFEQKNAAGRTVVERPASAADFEQLRTAATGAGASIEGVSVRSKGARIEASGRDIEITYADGWKEEIADERYEMKDPNDHTVVERAATSTDRSRLESLLDF